MIWLGDSRPAALKSEKDTKDNLALTEGEREASDYIEDSRFFIVSNKKRTFTSRALSTLYLQTTWTNLRLNDNVL